jgi:putative component of toxin-antitoxin plasmid stabilization module
MTFIRVAMSVAAAALAGVAAADARPARDARPANERLLAAAVAAANAGCGSAVAVKLADSSRPLEPTQRENITRGCRQAFEGIRLVCKTQGGRAAVSAQIKRVNCSESGERPAVSLDRGVLEYRIEPGLAFPNDSQMVHDYLLDNLQVEGQPLSVQVLKPREEAALANELAETNRQCGTSITAKFDWAGVPAPAIKLRSPSNYCGHALDGVARVCADGAGREAVAKRVKRIVCGYAGERSISLEDGVLIFKSDFKSSGDRGAVLEYLQNAL